jgi:hypothetical protein
VTVTVEGDTPLQVELPKDTLAGESAAVWSAVRVGDAKSDVLPGGRERWTQKYHCSPYVPGDALPLEFAPIRVKAGPAVEPSALVEKPLYFKVATDLVGAKAEDARPVTGVIELPPDPLSPVGFPALWAIAGGALLIAGAGVFAALRRRKRLPEVPPVEEALAALEAAGDPPRLDRVAEVVRRFLRRRYGLPSGTATTAELLALVRERTHWPDQLSEELGEILAVCDRAKFADAPPDEETATENRDRAWSWVTAVAAEEDPRRVT